MLRSQSKSAATSDGCEQKLRNNLSHDFAAKIAANEISIRWRVETCIVWMSFDFLLKIFLSSLPLKIIVKCNYEPTINNLISKICLASLMLMTCLMIKPTCEKRNISTTMYLHCDNMCQSKFCCQEFQCFFPDLKNRLEPSDWNLPWLASEEWLVQAIFDYPFILFLTY